MPADNARFSTGGKERVEENKIYSIHPKKQYKNQQNK